MKIRLKRLEDQVMVITGASSGIGLVTARMASKRGARLVLAARSEGSLGELAREIEGRGGKAVAVVADVANRDDVRKVAQAAEDTFGGFDTWVNNAGVSIYGKTTDVPVEDMRRLFETNFWGVVNGSLEAVEHLRERGGALINLGSTLGDRTSVLQGPYSASKHAVKGFTDGLRMDLDLEKAPISVSLVKPGPIDTPYPLNAKNYLDRENKHPAPTYAPDLVAEAILPLRRGADARHHHRRRGATGGVDGRAGPPPDGLADGSGVRPPAEVRQAAPASRPERPVRAFRAARGAGQLPGAHPGDQPLHRGGAAPRGPRRGRRGGRPGARHPADARRTRPGLTLPPRGAWGLHQPQVPASPLKGPMTSGVIQPP